MNGEELYRLRLQHLPDGERALQQALGREDDYRQFVIKCLQSSNVSQAVIDSYYSGWQACCGGGSEMLELLQQASAMVADAAAHTPAEVPPFHCGLWPALDVNASSRRIGDSAVVYVNYGLLLGLRVLTQCIARAFPDIARGEYTELSDRASAEFGTYCAKYLARSDVQAGSNVALLAGPPEILRRQLMLGALLYTIAHEAGHLARCRPFKDGWADDNQDFVTHVDDSYTLPPADTEVEVVRACSSEEIADLIAEHILRTAPCTVGDQPPHWLVLGAMSVLLLQGGLWWRTAALTDWPLGWSHPYPDMRVLEFSLTFPLPQKDFEEFAMPRSATEPPRKKTLTEVIAQRFRDWAYHVLAIDTAKAMVAEVGLADRGISPLSLLMLYSTDDSMPKLPSDVVQASRSKNTATPDDTPEDVGKRPEQQMT